MLCFFFQAEDGIRDLTVTGVQTCALPISGRGDDWVKIGGLKGYMDGSAGSRTAYFFEPYSDSAGYNGLLQHPEADMRSWIGSADSAGTPSAPLPLRGPPQPKPPSVFHNRN